MPRKKPTPEPEPPKPEESGGVGGPRRPSGRASLADLKLFGHALAQGWNVPADLRNKATRRIGEVLDDAKAGSRSWIAASRTLVSMTTATLSSIDTAIRAKQGDELAEEVKALRSEVDEIRGGQQP